MNKRTRVLAHEIGGQQIPSEREMQKKFINKKVFPNNGQIGFLRRLRSSGNNLIKTRVRGTCLWPGTRVLQIFMESLHVPATMYY